MAQIIQGIRHGNAKELGLNPGDNIQLNYTPRICEIQGPKAEVTAIEGIALRFKYLEDYDDGKYRHKKGEIGETHVTLNAWIIKLENLEKKIEEDSRLYFEHSQKVKQEIESDSQLVRNINHIFESRDKNLILGEGRVSQVFYVGKTKSGLYVALRLTNERHFEMQGFDTAVNFGERYCAVANALSIAYKQKSYHTRPVHFCVSVVHQDKTPGLLLEDITENRKYELENRGWMFERTRDGKELDAVHADLDGFDSLDLIESELKKHDLEIQMRNPPYFSKENRINL